MSEPQLFGRHNRLARILALVLVVGISIFLYSIRGQTVQLARYGYPGIFVLSLLTNASLLLPLPSLAIPFAAGTVLHPVGVALAAGAGATLGELTGYAAGFGGQAVFARSSIYDRMEGWTRRYGGWGIMIVAFIPNPLFDVAGAAAGALGMPVLQFLFWTGIGKTLKMLVVALAGASSASWILELMTPDLR